MLVQRSSAIASSVASASNDWRGIDHGGARRQTAERADAHAEAVVQGHGDAHPIRLAVPEYPGDRPGVVEHVVVGEGGPLGVARRAARVLDVDRVVGVETRLSFGEPLGVDPPPRGRQLLEDQVVLATARLVADDDDALEGRQVAADLGDHGQILGGLEAGALTRTRTPDWPKA